MDYKDTLLLPNTTFSMRANLGENEKERFEKWFDNNYAYKKMKENPANTIKDTMWKFLMDKGQKSNIPALKEYVYDLIQMTTQKTAGQREVKGHISWDELDMTMVSIVIEATALVLSGDLDEIEGKM